jgi:hypothetical protein
MSNIASAHAIADARTFWNDDDLMLLRRIVIDTLPRDRRRFIMLLYGKTGKCQAVRTTTLAIKSGASHDTVKRMMEQYTYLKLVTKYQPNPRADATWQLRPEIGQLITECGLLSNGPHLPDWKRK